MVHEKIKIIIIIISDQLEEGGAARMFKNIISKKCIACVHDSQIK